MMLPLVLSKHCLDHSLMLELQLPADLFWFKGHFPGQPILPGVSQLNWVIHFARQDLGVINNFAGFDVIKFQRPLLPEQKVSLSIEWLQDKNKLIFSFDSGERQASSGKINLCP
ncbi:hydroxymyristoyl-ACP dehydratase [Rouxiella sp. WC2420]|uniref:Hydroxymyristoyl-ACP dehydratase n=1 Tax=Rouxiella sp. WC2420 TaxID=3234145 RepID=A0AB39VTD2_9GAMM